MIAIFRKELKFYFTTILGYIVMAIYFFIGFIVFNNYFLQPQNSNSFSAFFSDMNTILLVAIPILTIRLLAEDKKLGTYELLMTSPVTPWGIMIGKFLGLFIFLSISVTLLWIYPLLISFYVPVDWGTVLAGYLGILASISFFIAAGMFTSSLTDNYVITGLLSFLLFLILFIISNFGNVTDNLFSNLMHELSYSAHYNGFANGLFKIQDIFYFAFGTFFWLLLGKTVVESRTWK